MDDYGWAKLWENDGKSFTVSTTISRLSGSDQYCAGITLYERANGKTNKLLIGVEMEGNLFFCKDYLRNPFYYNYEGWQWNNESEINLTVSYKAGDSTATSILTIQVANRNYSKSKTTTYTLDQINAMISDAVDGETKSYGFTFTGDFEIGLGGNENKCVFTNVSFGFTTFNVTFVDAYGRKTVTKYDDGATLNIPTVTEREGYEFLGWAEKQADGTYGEPGEIVDLAVTSNREFVAKFNLVGLTHEKPALGSNIYTATDKENVVNSDGKYVLHTEVGAAFFSDVEIEQNQNFVVYATIDSLEDNPDGVGFVVGTLGADNAAHMMFNWRASDIYVTREDNYVDGTKVWGWRGYDSNPSTAISLGAPATMALVYKDGYYYMFINDEKIASFDEDGKMGSWQSYTVQSTIGTEGTKKIGLSVISTKATFSDWGYSTDATEIDEYFAKPYTGYELDSNGFVVGNGDFEYVENTIKLTDSTYLFKDVSVAYGASFAIEATIQPTNNQFGFVLSAANGYYLQFVYRANENDIYLWSDGTASKWLSVGVAAEVDVFGANNDTETVMTLVYKEGVYYVFFDGVLGCQVSETKDDGGWGKTAVQAIGSGETIKFGLAARKPDGGDEFAIFSEVSYTTDATEIAEYVS